MKTLYFCFLFIQILTNSLRRQEALREMQKSLFDLESSVNVGQSKLVSQDLKQSELQESQIQKYQQEQELKAKQEMQQQLIEVQKKFIDEVNTKTQVENQKLWKENMELQKELTLLKQQAKIEIENLNDKVLSYETYIKKMRQDFDEQMQSLQDENKQLKETVQSQQQKLDQSKVPDSVKQWMQQQMN